jgi:hypothetical protein
MSTATSIGWAGYPQGDNFFYGFDVDTEGGIDKIKGFIESCEGCKKIK